MAEQWKAAKTKDSPKPFWLMTPDELDEAIERALDEETPTAESGRLEEKCDNCKKMKDVGVQCWWCGC